MFGRGHAVLQVHLEFVANVLGQTAIKHVFFGYVIYSLKTWSVKNRIGTFKYECSGSMYLGVQGSIP